MAAALEGLKVLDLSWVMVGPVSARYLADLGANVVKVESSRRIDPLRTLGPFKDGKPGAERTLSYHNLNAGKRSITINIREADGRALILRLARWADVVLESFTPGVLDDIGLGYAQLSSNNPALIMVSTGLLGQTGPDARGTSGVGTMGAAMSGATYLIGWPDRAPTGPFGPWTDSVTPRFIVASILAALHRRTRDGRGCYIDIAQADAGIQFVAPAFYESARNATIPERRSIAGSPLRPAQGVFPCASEDRWIAIDAPRTDRWTALRLVAEGALDEPAFDTLIGRMRRRAELDLAIADWTRPQEGAQLERRLQDHRVPAHIVSRGNDLAADPHLRESGYFRKIDDPVIGEAEIEPPRFTLARTPNPPTRRGPRIGEHTRDVLREILAMTDAEIDAITARGVLT